MPDVTAIGVLVNPDDPSCRGRCEDVQAAARAIGLQLDVFSAQRQREIDAAFATLSQRADGGLFVAGDPFFTAVAC